MLTDIKFSKAQLFKIMQSGGFLDALVGKCAVPVIKVAVPLAKNLLTPLAAMESVSAIDVIFKKKNVWQRCCKSRKRNQEWISWYVIRNFRCFSVKYFNWKKVVRAGKGVIRREYNAI